MISDGKEDYELVYGMKRLQLCEQALGNRSVLQCFTGVPSVHDLLTICAYGMRRAGKESWVSPTQGYAAAERAMEEGGFMPLYREASEALERDCGFLFLNQQ